MGAEQKVTAQGVRDLNHTGPRQKPVQKPEQSSAEASGPAPATPDTIDEAPPAKQSIAANEQTAGSSAVGDA